MVKPTCSADAPCRMVNEMIEKKRKTLFGENKIGRRLKRIDSGYSN